MTTKLTMLTTQMDNNNNRRKKNRTRDVDQLGFHVVETIKLLRTRCSYTCSQKKASPTTNLFLHLMQIIWLIWRSIWRKNALSWWINATVVFFKPNLLCISFNGLWVCVLLFIGRVNMHGNSFIRIRTQGQVLQRWRRLM